MRVIAYLPILWKEVVLSPTLTLALTPTLILALPIYLSPTLTLALAVALTLAVTLTPNSNPDTLTP